VSEWAFVALGSNVGDRAAQLRFARERLAALPHTRLTAVSAVEETAPIGPVDQGPFLNQMVLLRTDLSARALLAACLEIERHAGRERRERWGPRSLDLDLVRYGGHHIAEPGLTVPHPEIARRPFWQRELAQLEPKSGDAPDDADEAAR
jgi:2-amino-4-hydroxy-6-hydroxymethyldihydropteridine diphosphokinase